MAQKDVADTVYVMQTQKGLNFKVKRKTGHFGVFITWTISAKVISWAILGFTMLIL